MIKKIRFNVKWDEAGNRLPKKFISDVCMPEDLTEDEYDDFLSDWLSDEFGYCHLGFNYEMI